MTFRTGIEANFFQTYDVQAKNENKCSKVEKMNLRLDFFIGNFSNLKFRNQKSKFFYESPVELGGGHFGLALSVLADALEEHFLVESAPADCRFHADVQQ